MIPKRNNCSSSKDITSIEFSKIEGFLDSLNIKHVHLSKVRGATVNINNDIKLEGDIKYWGNTNGLFTMGCFSYSRSNLGYGVNVGRYSSIANNVKIMGAHHFTDWVSTSPVFYDSDYHDLDASILTHLSRTKRLVNIGNDVWIGENVTLKPNINIGDGAIIASNSVVTKDVPPFMIVAGTPAKIIKSRFNDNVIEHLSRLRWWRFHKDSFKGMKMNNPLDFIYDLDEMIHHKNMETYSPKIITMKDIMANISE